MDWFVRVKETEKKIGDVNEFYVKKKKSNFDQKNDWKIRIMYYKWL